MEMPKELILLALAFAIPTATAVVVLYAPLSFQKKICRAMVLVLHISPWTWGPGTFKEMWSKEYSKREAFLSAWFLTFVFGLITAAYFAVRLGL
jgi:hypothetical protein